jgi:chromosome segregation ATPase
LEEIDRKKNAKTNLEKQINDLNDHKKVLEEEQNRNIKEQNEIKGKIKNTSNQITYIIIRLQNISQKIEDIAMNNNHLKTQDEYIDSLKDKMDQIGMNDEQQKNNLKKMKEDIKIFREINELKEDEVMKLNDSQLAEKLGVIITKPKNSN